MRAPRGFVHLAILTIALCCLCWPRAASAHVSQCSETLASVGDIEMNLADSEECVVDPDDPSTVPVCLTEGASAVAPRTLHGTSDARIEAAKRCTFIEAPDGVDRPSENAPGYKHDKAPHAALWAPCLVPVLEPVPTIVAWHEDAIGQRGHPGGIYRPPRA